MTNDMTPDATCAGCRTNRERPGACAAAERDIGRRTFLIESGLLAAIAALNACGGADATAPDVPANSMIEISNYPALANIGGVTMVTLGSAPVAIVRTGASSFLALSRVCPHQGGLIVLSRNDFVCQEHGATFNTSGQWVGGQGTSNMHQYTTSYDATAGTLTIG